MSGDKQTSNQKKKQVYYISPRDPPFLRKIKEKMGFKPPPTIENKFSTTAGEGYVENDQAEEDLSRMKEEDRPQVVVLDKKSDLSEKEVKAHLDSVQADEERKMIEEGKIVFRKPMKRENEQHEETGSRKRRRDEKEVVESNSRLLSFNDDDEED